MSLETWKAEYHVDLPTRATRLAMLLAAERKYVGGREQNLRRHGLIRDDGAIQEQSETADNPYHFGDQCALCDRYEMVCDRCPLYRVNKASCVAAVGSAALSPWACWELDGDPEPMLALIRKAIRAERKRLARRAGK